MNKKHKQLLLFLIRIFSLALLAALLLTFVITPRIVRGNGMYPSLRDGQLVLVFRPGRILRDDLVLYRNLKGEEQVGRVIAEGSDVVEIQEEAGIIVNDNLLIRRIPYTVPAGSIEYPYQVQKDSFFLVNDYRDDLEDSRSFGAIPREEIVGAVVFAFQYRDF